jgi:hypothetical protein
MARAVFLIAALGVEKTSFVGKNKNHGTGGSRNKTHEMELGATVSITHPLSISGDPVPW